VIDMRVSESLRSAIQQDLYDVCRVTQVDPASLLPLMLEETRYAEYFNELHAWVGDLAGRQILEVGSGYGAMLTYGCLARGLDIQGVEPSKRDYDGRYEIAQKMLAENGLTTTRIREGVGEQLPFADASFDVVYSFQVLEHVQDPFRVLAEAWRVLRPGGILYCNAPNYRTFFEGHYNVLWFPYWSKRAAKLYLRMLRRNPALIDHLNFLTEPDMRGWLEEICQFPIHSDWGLSDWVRRMRAPVFSDYTNSNLTKIARIGQRLGLLRVLAYMGQKFKWQDTLRVAVRKPLGRG
jgi:ubiquinone/menaquinone biosynthesis C-methylase UbiE